MPEHQPVHPPVDAVGRPLKVGDKVIIPFFIKEISGDELSLKFEFDEKGHLEVDAEHTYRANPGDEIYTGSDPDNDGDVDEVGKPVDPGGD